MVILYVIAGIYMGLLVIGITMGYLAWKKRSESVIYGSDSVMHFVMGIMFPYVEIIPAAIELSS